MTDKIKGGTINVEGNGFVKTGSAVKVRKAKLKKEPIIPNVYDAEFTLILQDGSSKTESVRYFGTLSDSKKLAEKYLQNYLKNSSFVLKDTTGIIVEQQSK